MSGDLQPAVNALTAFTPPNVLIVGDESACIATMIASLRERGVCPYILSSSGPCLTLTTEGDIKAQGFGPFAVLVLENGLDLEAMVSFLIMVRGEAPFDDLKIVTLTKFEGSAERRELIKAGANYLLNRSIDVENLFRVIHAAKESAAIAELLQSYVASHKSAIGRIKAGVFEIKTMEEAQKLATMLATNFDDAETLALGLWELLANAIEHGNLEISYDDKANLLNSGGFEFELQQRMHIDPFKDRVVTVEFTTRQRSAHFRITDQGPGFDHKEFFQSSDEPKQGLNGRGITIARRLSFHRLSYKGKGNIVYASVRLPRPRN